MFSLYLGTLGDDTLLGNNLTNDILIAFKGNDKVNGLDGDDLLIGGRGNDELRGGAGCDILFGNGGNDTLLGGHGNDFLFGGAGNDLLVGGGECDFMVGGKGADTFRLDIPGSETIVKDFNYAEGDRVFLQYGYKLADATIVDNGNKHAGVTLSFTAPNSTITSITLLGVDKVADVSAAWFI